MRLKEHALCCAFAWSPAKLGSPPMLATASYYGAMDDNFSSDPVLDIRLVDVRNTDETDMPLAGSAHLPARACRVDWSPHAVAPQGIVAVACEDGAVYVYSVTALLEGSESAALLCTIRAHRGCVRGCQFNVTKPDVLATGGDDGEWFVWNLKPVAATAADGGGGAHTVLEATKVCVMDGAGGGGGAAAAAGGGGHGKALTGRDHGHAAIVDLQWHPRRAHILATATAANSIHVWNLRTTSLAVALNLTKAARGGVVSCLAWHPAEATQLAVGLDGGARAVVQLWELKCSMTPKAELVDTGSGAAGGVMDGSSGGGGGGAVAAGVAGHGSHGGGGSGGAAGGLLLDGGGGGRGGGGVSALSWNAHDAAQLVAAYADGRTVVFDTTRYVRVAALRAEASPVVAVQWCPAIAHVLATSSFAPLLCVSTADDESGGGGGGGAAVAGRASAAVGGGMASMLLSPGATAATSMTSTTTAAGGGGGSAATTATTAATMTSGADVPSWLRRPCGASVNFAMLVASAAPPSSSSSPGVLQLTQLAVPPLSPRTREDMQLQHELAALPADSPERAAWLNAHEYSLLAAVASARSSRKPILQFLDESNNNDDDSSSTTSSMSKRRNATTAAAASQADGSEDKDDVFDAMTRQQQRSFEERAAAAVAQGRVEEAVDVCLAEDRYDDAFALAYLRGGEVLARVHAQYTQYVHAQPRRERRHVLLAGAIASGDYVALIHAHVPWREVLALVVAFVGDGFAEMCNALGDALRGCGEYDGAYTCYVCARNVDAVLSLWQVQGHSSRQVVRDALLLEQVTERAAGGAFFAACLHRYGVKLLLDGHTAEALTYLQRAAQLGEPAAQVLVNRARPLLTLSASFASAADGSSGGQSDPTRDFPFAYEPIADAPSATAEALLHVMQQRQREQEAAAAAAAAAQQQQQLMYQQQQQQQRQQMMYAQQRQQPQQHPPPSLTPPPPPSAAAQQTMSSMYGRALPPPLSSSQHTPAPPALPPQHGGMLPPPPQQQQQPGMHANAPYSSNSSSGGGGGHMSALPANRRNIPLVAMPAAATAAAAAAPGTLAMPGRAPSLPQYHLPQQAAGAVPPPPPPPSGTSAAAAYNDPMSYNYYAHGQAPASSAGASGNNVMGGARAASLGMPGAPPPPLSMQQQQQQQQQQQASATSSMPPAARPSALAGRASSMGSAATTTPQPRLMPHPVSAYSSLRTVPPPPPPSSSSSLPQPSAAANGAMPPPPMGHSYSNNNSMAAAAAGGGAAAYGALPPPPSSSSLQQQQQPPRAGSMPSMTATLATTRSSANATPAAAAAAPPPPLATQAAMMPSYYTQGNSGAVNNAAAPSPQQQQQQAPMSAPYNGMSALRPQAAAAAAAVPQQQQQPPAGGPSSIVDADVQALRSPTAQHVVQRLQQLVPHIADTRRRHAVDQAAVQLFQLLLQGAITDDVQQLLLQYVNAAGTPAAKSTWLLIAQRSAAAVRSFVNLRYL